MTKLTTTLLAISTLAACALDDETLETEDSEQSLGATTGYTELPYFEDFDDGTAPELVSRSMFYTKPAWSVAMQRLHGYSNKAVSIATINSPPLPPRFRLAARIGYPVLDVIDWLEARYPGEGYLVFDFKSKSDFKYARVAVAKWGAGNTNTYRCVIGTLVGTVDTKLAVVPSCVIVDHDVGPAFYTATVEGAGATVRLFVDGQLEVTYTFAAGFSGIAGVGAATHTNAIIGATSATGWVRSKFDDLRLEAIE